MVVRVVRLRAGREEPADLAGGEPDQVVTVLPGRIARRGVREICPQALVPPLSGGDGQECQREHREGDVPVPGVVAADLVVVQAGLVLGGLEALLDRPPGPGHGDQRPTAACRRGVAGEERQLAAA